MTDLSYQEKKDLISRYVNHEEVFRYCRFDVPTGKKKVHNPYRNDNKPGCYFKWNKGVLWFFDWTCPFLGESPSGSGINIQGAVKLYNGWPLGKDTNNQAIDFIVDTFVWGIAEAERNEKIKLVQSQKRKHDKPDVIKIIAGSQDLPRDNYFTQYYIPNADLKREDVYLVTSFKIIKNGEDITHFFPNETESNGLTIGYKYNQKWKLYWPLYKPPESGWKKARFMSNINAAKTIEGYDQLKHPGHDTMILMGSKKDYMVGRYALSLNADIWATQNEGTPLPTWLNAKTNKAYKNRYLLFDTDNAGIKAAARLVLKQYYTGMILVQRITENEKLLKDPGDWVKRFKPEGATNIIRKANIIPYGKIQETFGESASEAYSLS